MYIYLCFIDFDRTFNKVRHVDLLRMVEKLNIDKKEIRLIMSYQNERAAVRMQDGKLNFKI